MKLNAHHHFVTQSHVFVCSLQSTEVVSVEEKLSYIPVKTAKKTLAHRTLQPKVQGSISAQGRTFIFSMPPFHDTFFIRQLAIYDA